MSEGDDATNVLLSLERQGLRILVSGNDETAGGVGSIGSDGFRLVDRIPTSGLASNGAAVVRGIMDSLYDGAQETTVIVTDDRGLKRLERLDDIGEIHDIAFDGDSLIVVSTGNDTIARIESTSFAASTSTILHTSGKRTDQHHLNCLAIHDGQLFATAFESRKGRRWRKKTVGEPRSGVLFNVTTGENVMANLDMPHFPQKVEGLVGSGRIWGRSGRRRSRLERILGDSL